MQEESMTKEQDNQLVNNARISNILIGVLIIVVAVLAFNFFQSDPDSNNAVSENGDRIDNQIVVPDATSTPTEEPNNTETTEYTVKNGESLWKIAANQLGNGYLWTEIAKINGIEISQASRIESGDVLVLPAVAGTSTNDSIDIKPQTYTVVKGDTLWSIAASLYGDGFQWTKIYDDESNNITEYTARDGHKYLLIEPGDVLNIPALNE